MLITSHRELKVYNNALDAAVAVHKLTQQFPRSELWRLTDQILRSSRSPCASIAEAWRARRYIAHFQSKLGEAQGEAAETQVWLEFARRVSYIEADVFDNLFGAYEVILGQLSVMSRDAGKWTRR